MTTPSNLDFNSFHFVETGNEPGGAFDIGGVQSHPQDFHVGQTDSGISGDFNVGGPPFDQHIHTDTGVSLGDFTHIGTSFDHFIHH